MSTAPITSSSPAEIENLGALFIGFVVSTVLYGFTFFQTYIYYTRYPNDRRWIRYFVATLCTLDTAASALVSEVVYYYLITLFNVNLDVLYATTTFCVQYMLSVILVFISHLFFAHRVFQVTGGSRLLIVMLACLSFIALVFGLSTTGQMFAHRRLSAFGSLQMKVTTAISQAMGIMADVVVLATMCYSLRPGRYPEIVVPHGFIPGAITVLIGRGLAFTVVQTAYFCVFVVAPSRPLWIPLQMVASKFYVNTLLGHLNSRDVKHGRGVNEEDTTVRDVSPSARLSNSIRFHVPKAQVTQTVDLVTRPDEIESDSTGIETRKVYQGDNGNDSTQGLDWATKSQADNEMDKVGLSELCN